jgi:hypothetical protein
VRPMRGVVLVLLAITAVAVRGWHALPVPVAEQLVPAGAARAGTGVPGDTATLAACPSARPCAPALAGSLWLSAGERMLRAGLPWHRTREPAEALVGRLSGHYLPIPPADDLVSSVLDP